MQYSCGQIIDGGPKAIVEEVYYGDGRTVEVLTIEVCLKQQLQHESGF